MGIPRVFGKKLWVFEAFIYEKIGRVFVFFWGRYSCIF